MLFVLEMANNHQGDVEHGLDIISSLGQVIRSTRVNAAIKFQFRQLETFIHPDYVDRKDLKHIPRFLETRLAIADYEKYFRALTGESSADFIVKWEHKVDELEEIRKRTNKLYREEEGAFLLSLAKLLSNGKKFTKFGRIYKIIDPNT